MDKSKLDLSKLEACPEAKKWFDRQEGSLEEIFNRCEKADWLLWLAETLELDCKAIVLATCGVAESVLKYIPDGEDRPKTAIETARRWAKGEATLGEVEKASDAAHAAARAARAAAHYAAYAAHAAAHYAAHAADAHYAAYAAHAAAHYASDASAADDNGASLADIVRARLPWEVWQEAILKQED